MVVVASIEIPAAVVAEIVVAAVVLSVTVANHSAEVAVAVVTTSVAVVNAMQPTPCQQSWSFAASEVASAPTRARNIQINYYPP